MPQSSKLDIGLANKSSTSIHGEILDRLVVVVTVQSLPLRVVPLMLPLRLILQLS